MFLFFLSFKCHKQKWCMLFFIRIKQVARALACARAIARIKWRRLDIGIFWGQKIRQEKLTKFTKILNYIKFSPIFVCKCLDISIIYISYSYKKNQHILVQRYWQISVRGIGTFWTISSLHVCFLCVKMSRYSHYILLTKRINKFWVQRFLKY